MKNPGRVAGAIKRALMDAGNGAEGDRTPNLFDATEALSQIELRPRWAEHSG